MIDNYRYTLRLKLITLDKEVHQIDTATNTDVDIGREYQDLFEDKLGELPVVYRMKVDEAVTPIVKPSRRIPHAMESKVKEKLHHME